MTTHLDLEGILFYLFSSQLLNLDYYSKNVQSAILFNLLSPKLFQFKTFLESAFLLHVHYLQGNVTFPALLQLPSYEVTAMDELSYIAPFQH